MDLSSILRVNKKYLKGGHFPYFNNSIFCIQYFRDKIDKMTLFAFTVHFLKPLFSNVSKQGEALNSHSSNCIVIKGPWTNKDLHTQNVWLDVHLIIQAIRKQITSERNVKINLMHFLFCYSESPNFFWQELLPFWTETIKINVNHQFKLVGVIKLNTKRILDI